jgi:hypothetical protein
MPEPNRPPWLITAALDGVAIDTLIAKRRTLIIECDACANFSKWGPDELKRRFRRSRHHLISELGPRLRCSRCRSDWVRISAQQ